MRAILLKQLLACLPLVLLCALPVFEEVKAADEPIIKGTRYVNLKQVAARLGMSFAVSKPGKSVILASKWTRIEFTVHKRSISIDGVKVHIGYPIAYKGGGLYMSRADYNQAIAPILTPQVFKRFPRLRHIVIDPGHGGRDVGAVYASGKFYEKDLALDLAKRLKRLLEKQGYRVTLTRSGDSYVSLSKRSELANRMKADLFISVHFNASSARQAHGIETFAYTPRFQPSTGRSYLTSSDKRGASGNENDPWNMLLSFYTQRELLRSLKRSDRGCKRARFSVLKALSCPGVLVEAGFVSNREEGQVILQSAYREQVAKSIAEGVSRYHQTLRRLAER